MIDADVREMLRSPDQMFIAFHAREHDSSLASLEWAVGSCMENVLSERRDIARNDSVQPLNDFMTDVLRVSFQGGVVVAPYLASNGALIRRHLDANRWHALSSHWKILVESGISLNLDGISRNAPEDETESLCNLCLKRLQELHQELLPVCQRHGHNHEYRPSRSSCSMRDNNEEIEQICIHCGSPA